MSTETNNKTPNESEHCTCNKPCHIHTEVESSIKDQSRDLLNEEVIIHNIKKVISPIVFALICTLYIRIFGSDDIIYILDILFNKEDLRPNTTFLIKIAFGMIIIAGIIDTIVYIFVKQIRVYIRNKFSFDLIYKF